MLENHTPFDQPPTQQSNNIPIKISMLDDQPTPTCQDSERNVQTSPSHSPILFTERPFLATEFDYDKDVNLIPDVDDKFDILKLAPALKVNDHQTDQPHFAQQIVTERVERYESFESIAEEHEDLKVQEFPFQTTKRRANCCSLFTYWYANTLVDSVELNDGKMSTLFIESMNSDPNRDSILLTHFQMNLKSRYELWKRKNPNQKAGNEWYDFTKSALKSSVGCHFVEVAVITFFAEIFSLFSIFMIKYFSQYLTKEESDLQEATMLVALFSFSILIGSLLRNFYIYYGQMMSLEIRKLLISAIYDKVNKLSMRSLTETKSGRLITMVSQDIFNCERSFSMAPLCLASPFINLACYVLIWIIAGWPYAIAIFGLWVVTILLQVWTARRLSVCKQEQQRRNDERLKLVNDMINGIYTIKAYAWEKHYQKKVQNQRALQEKSVFCLNLVGSLGFNIFQNIGLVAILCILLPKWFMGEELLVTDSFTLLALVYYLFFNINSLTYQSISTMGQVYAVIYRLSEVLRLEEYERLHDDFITADKPAISIKDGQYSWGFSKEKSNAELGGNKRAAKINLMRDDTLVLKGISVELLPQDLLVVVGKIGSGKTSLLYSIMDETIKVAGTHQVCGRVAYVEQEPFIFPGTICENICFGLQYTECRYRKALVAAQLDDSMLAFQDGSQTIVGEGGMKLSNSFRARISLARAIYLDADIYLLDDLLFQVEPVYAEKIFTETIQGVLKQKCVVLVTHQVEFLQKAEKIMVLRDGQQALLGRFKEIVQQGFNIDEILSQFSKVTHRAAMYKEEMKVKETKKQKIQLKLLRQMTSQCSEREYVAAVNGNSNSKISEDESEEATMIRKQLRQRERNIKLLRKQVMVLAQEELGKNMKNDNGSMQSTTTSGFRNIHRQKTNKANTTIAEQKEESKIKWKDVKDFFSFSYGYTGMVCLFLICLITAITQLLPSIWLVWWLDINKDNQSEQVYPIVFCSLIALFLLFTIFRSLALFKVLLKSATNMHEAITMSVLRANILFFDQNPLNRILSRFSKDMLVFDLVVPIVAIITIQGFFRVGTVIIMICIINPIMIVVTIFTSILVFLTIRKGKPVMIESQKRDAEAKAPIQEYLSSMTHGIVSMRACNKTDFFRQDFLNKLAIGTNASFCYVLANRWISIRLDILCCIFMSFVCFFVILMKGQYDASWLTMTLQVATDIIFLFSISFRMYAEIQNHVESSQRMVEYTRLEEEDELEKAGDADLERRQWPTAGKIEFEEATMRYRDEQEPSLNNLSFKAQAGMLIGIVGNTGSGKSSILHALFRLKELEYGRTTIDGVDISQVGLHTLRKSIAFIPQSPFLLKGTIRENLDPLDECTDSQIDAILREVNMYEKIYSLPQNLNSSISESNNLFSSGQKQLLCLARAIIRKTKVLVLDEATTSIDLETDSLIQKTLRERFKNCTVFIIAHRIATIIDADRVLVLQDGKLQEYSHPYNLLVEQEGDKTITNIKGQFARIIISLGIENAHNLFEIAEKSHHQETKYYEPLKNSLSVTDNRTGKTYELQIQNNSISAAQLLQIKNMSGNVTRSYDPAYLNTVNCISRISYIDGEKGILEYRGYPIDQLSRRSRFIETAFLLIYGQLPSKNQLLAFESRVRICYPVDMKLAGFIQSYQQDLLAQSHPMSMMQTLIACLSICHPESNPSYFGGQFNYKCQEERDTHIHRVLGQAPSIAAACFRIYIGQDIIDPDINLGYAENFLQMTLGDDNQIAKNPKIAQALETLFILHAEHELSCSTAAMRHMTSVLADVYSSLSGAITAVYGPRQGGACEAIFKMLEEIGTVENVASYIRLVKRQERMLMGFGHRSYSNNDPRVTIVKQVATEVFQITGKEELIEVAQELERVVLTDNFFTQKKLYPNFDFYSGLIFRALGYPVEYFTVLYSLPKFAGWMAHWNEFILDPENRVVRPRQIYMGERSRNYVGVNDRLPDESADYMVKDSPKLNINLPTIQSIDTSSLSASMTDASIDADRKLFLSKRASDQCIQLSPAKSSQNNEIMFKKSQFNANQEQENSDSDENSQENHDFSDKDNVVDEIQLADPNYEQHNRISSHSEDQKSYHQDTIYSKRELSQMPIKKVSSESNSMNGGFSDNESPSKIRVTGGFDVSIALDEAPVAKARTVTNLFNLLDNKQTNQNVNMNMTNNNQHNTRHGKKASTELNYVQLPAGALQNSEDSFRYQ